MLIEFKIDNFKDIVKIREGLVVEFKCRKNLELLDLKYFL